MEKFKNGNVKETEEEVKMKGRNRVEIFRLRQVSKKGGGLDETNYTYISARARAHRVCVLNEVVARPGRSYFSLLLRNFSYRAPALQPTTSGLFQPYVWTIRPTFGTCSPLRQGRIFPLRA